MGAEPILSNGPETTLVSQGHLPVPGGYRLGIIQTNRSIFRVETDTSQRQKMQCMYCGSYMHFDFLLYHLLFSLVCLILKAPYI